MVENRLHTGVFVRGRMLVGGLIAIIQGGVNAPSLAACGKGGLAKKLVIFCRKGLTGGSVKRSTIINLDNFLCAVSENCQSAETDAVRVVEDLL
jgi:hypothetical protein